MPPSEYLEIATNKIAYTHDSSTFEIAYHHEPSHAGRFTRVQNAILHIFTHLEMTYHHFTTTESGTTKERERERARENNCSKPKEQSKNEKYASASVMHFAIASVSAAAAVASTSADADAIALVSVDSFLLKSIYNKLQINVCI